MEGRADGGGADGESKADGDNGGAGAAMSGGSEEEECRDSEEEEFRRNLASHWHWMANTTFTNTTFAPFD